MPGVNERFVRVGAGFSLPPVNSCSVMWGVPGASPLDMEATITTPSGVTELCEIRDAPDNLFDVKFTPIENGTNIISIKQKGIHIAGIITTPVSFSVLKIFVFATCVGRTK